MKKRCPACSGTGVTYYFNAPCKTCHGKGFVGPNTKPAKRKKAVRR